MKFGLLCYRTDNLGDDMQSIAARRFLPRVDRYVDREALDELGFANGERLKLIMNGWFCHHPDKWPPAQLVEPLLVSFHVTNNPEPGTNVRAREEFARSPRILRYLQQHGPVGARDHSTLAWLRSQGIPSYFSGCLTLTLDAPPGRPREEFIVLNDVPDEVAAKIGAATKRPVRHTTHADSVTVGVQARFDRAAALIDLYARALCVVTTRLHGALPCLAMGTPVLLIDAHRDQSRFYGLNELVHHGSAAQILSGEIDYNVDDPPPNPGKHLGLRDELERRTAEFVASRMVSSPPLLTRLRERIASWI